MGYRPKKMMTKKKKKKKKKKKRRLLKKRQNRKKTCKIKNYIYITNTDKDCDLSQDRPMKIQQLP
jgi:hypothetical protein